MTSQWERDGLVEIDVEERPSRRTSSPTETRRASAERGVERARRGARALRVAAVVIAGASVLGALLTTFWLPENESFYPGGLRTRIGYMLQSTATPVALAALAFGLSLVVTLYAARVELARTPDDVAPGPAFTPPRP